MSLLRTESAPSPLLAKCWKVVWSSCVQDPSASYLTLIMEGTDVKAGDTECDQDGSWWSVPVVSLFKQSLWCPSGRMVLDKELVMIHKEFRYALHWGSTWRHKWVCQGCQVSIPSAHSSTSVAVPLEVSCRSAVMWFVCIIADQCFSEHILCVPNEFHILNIAAVQYSPVHMLHSCEYN